MADDEVVFETESPAGTEQVGRRLVELLPQGGVVALRGDLATGKTCLVRGMAAMGALQKQSDESLQAIFESLEVEATGELVSIAFEVDADMARNYLHLEAGEDSVSRP